MNDHDARNAPTKLSSFFTVALAFMPAPFATTPRKQPSCAPRSQNLNYPYSFIFLCLTLLGLAGAITACHSAPGKRYPLQAEVISADAPRKLIVVKHGEIPGLMPAMTMSYAVLDSKDIEALHPGDKISAELVVADNIGHLEKIVLVTKTSATPSLPPAK